MLSTRIRVAMFFATFMFALFISVFAGICPAAAETYVTESEPMPNTGLAQDPEQLPEEPDHDEITSSVIALIIAVVIVTAVIMLALVITPKSKNN